MFTYECGGFGKKRRCEACGAPKADPQPGPTDTVTIDCPGWQDDG
jgi:hypothetical protein